MTQRLRAAFLRAVGTAVATLGDVAEGSGIAYRTLHALKLGTRRVSPNAARGLVRYLRRRAKALARAADTLDATISKGEYDG